MRTRSVMLLAGLVASCAAPGESQTGTGPAPHLATTLAVPPRPEAPPVSGARAAYYRRALPGATRFAAKLIPKEYIVSADKGNETYVVAYDATGAVVGYLRDFAGPVTPADECPCNPLALTLAFNADLSFHTILAPAPLEKADSEAMTDEEVRRLIAIAKKPSQALLELGHAEELVDATTEATRPAYAGLVVDKAGYSTYRIVHLVRTTRKLIQGVPLAWDARRLQAILGAPATDAALARALAEFLPTTESEQTKLSVFKRMTLSYIASGRKDPEVEARLLQPGLEPRIEAEVVAAACYEMAAQSTHLDLARRCLERVRSKASAETLARLEGTLRFQRGDQAGAADLLLVGVRGRDLPRDPELHLRLVHALTQAGRTGEACARAKDLYRGHPALPGAKKVLRVCSRSGNVMSIITRLQSEQRAALLSACAPDNPSRYRCRRAGDAPASTMSLEGPGFAPIELPFAKPGKVTVVAFFSTWCPHCRQELPQINAFHKTVQALPSLRDRVRIIGVRTAMERETIAYDEFISEIKPTFDIWYDATMSLQFGRFAKEHGVSTQLPTVAIADSAGVVRYILSSAAYRDTQQELMWAVESLLEPPG